MVAGVRRGGWGSLEAPILCIARHKTLSHVLENQALHLPLKSFSSTWFFLRRRCVDPMWWFMMVIPAIEKWRQASGTSKLPLAT